MTVPADVPSSLDVLDVAEQAALFVERAPGYQGESPWEYHRGVAEALAWLQGKGPRPDHVEWCDPCNGSGLNSGRLGNPCSRCGGSGIAP